MNSTFRNTLLAALLIAALPAQAALQSYSFSGTLDSGLSIGQNFSGNFSFDDSSLSSSGLQYLGANSFSISFLGNTYSMAQQAAPTEISFIDGSFLGVSYAYNAAFPMFSLIASGGTGESWDVPYLAYSQLGTSGVVDGAGSIVYAPVPEPETYAMMLAGLGLLGLAARRRKPRQAS
jgi:hypothetical protein